MILEGFEQFENYPTQEEIDDWIASIWSLAEGTACDVEVMDRNGLSSSQMVWIIFMATGSRLYQALHLFLYMYQAMVLR